MIKKLVSKLFGFDRQIADLEQQIERLSWDSLFGMWTRGAFLQFCHVMPRGDRVVAFIDLDRIHHLNEELGYDEVDRRVKAMFSIPFRRSDVVARWFSGDEIVILFDSERDGAEMKVAELVESGKDQGLSFKYEIDVWKVGITPIDDVVKEMTEGITKQKSAERGDSDR